MARKTSDDLLERLVEQIKASRETREKALAVRPAITVGPGALSLGELISKLSGLRAAQAEARAAVQIQDQPEEDNQFVNIGGQDHPIHGVEERVKRADEVLGFYLSLCTEIPKGREVSAEEAVANLLMDLMHFTDVHEFALRDVLEKIEPHYMAQRSAARKAKAEAVASACSCGETHAEPEPVKVFEATEDGLAKLFMYLGAQAET